MQLSFTKAKGNEVIKINMPLFDILWGRSEEKDKKPYILLCIAKKCHRGLFCNDFRHIEYLFFKNVKIIDFVREGYFRKLTINRH